MSGNGAHTLGKYRFVATLGHGGMAEVFLAVALGPAGFNKLQVLKRLRPHLAEDPDLCEGFLAEARLAARLNHRNVVQTNEVGFDAGQYFMAMEYLDGQPLHRVLVQARRAGRALPLPIVSRVASDLLAGLHYAHELTDYDGTPLGVVHRDVSPQNVFVTYDGQVKIVDFGIAKTARRAVETASGVLKGKVAYMAPEQAFGEVDRRADVFSAGVVLWEMLTDRRLWQDMGDPEILAALASGTAILRQRPAEVDPELHRIAERALALDPEERYATAAALRAEIERAVPPCSAEELGAFVEGLFHEHRQQIRAALARQIDLVEHGEGDGLLELDRPSLRPPSLRPRRPISEGSAETPPPSTLESRIPPPPLLPSIAPGPSTSSPPALDPRRRAGRAVMLLSALVVSGATLVTFSRDRATGLAGGQPPAPAPPSAVAPQPSPSVAAAPEGAYIHLHLGATPADAKILVDGAALPSNPFDGKFVKDGAVHRIQVEAGGFMPQSRVLVFDKDQAVNLALMPRPRPPQEPQGMKPDPYR